MRGPAKRVRNVEVQLVFQGIVIYLLLKYVGTKLDVKHFISNMIHKLNVLGFG